MLGQRALPGKIWSYSQIVLRARRPSSFASSAPTRAISDFWFMAQRSEYRFVFVQLAFLKIRQSGESPFLGSEEPRSGRGQAWAQTAGCHPLTLQYSHFPSSEFSFLAHKFQIPGTALGDLTPVTSHPEPSGNSRPHFFVRNLAGEEVWARRSFGDSAAAARPWARPSRGAQPRARPCSGS